MAQEIVLITWNWLYFTKTTKLDIGYESVQRMTVCFHKGPSLEKALTLNSNFITITTVQNQIKLVLVLVIE